MTVIDVVDGESLPDLGLYVRENGTLLAGLATGYTVTLKSADETGTVLVTKTSGITGQAGNGIPPTGTPNVIVQWNATPSELAALDGGETYDAQLTITRTSDSRSRLYPFRIYVRPSL
jgi:hypothetical protein